MAMRPTKLPSARTSSSRPLRPHVFASAAGPGFTFSIRNAEPIEYWPCGDLHVRVFNAAHSRNNKGNDKADSSAASPPTLPAGAATLGAPAAPSAQGFPQAFLEAVVAPIVYVLERLDIVVCLQTNDRLGAIPNYGRNALLVAFDPQHTSELSQSSQSGGSETQAGHADTGVARARLARHIPARSSSSSDSSSDSSSSSSNSSAGRSTQPLGPQLASLHALVMQQVSGFAVRSVAVGVRPGVGLVAEEQGLLGVASLDSFGDKVPPRELDPMTTGQYGWYKRDGIAYLSNVAVLPAARRQGVARALVAAAETMAADWGCRAIGLHCNPKNAAAVQLYKGLGYRPTGVLEAPWLPYLMGRPPDRCMFMLKRLPVHASSSSQVATAAATSTAVPAAPAAAAMSDA